jgi:hypothetical protein
MNHLKMSQQNAAAPAPAPTTAATTAAANTIKNQGNSNNRCDFYKCGCYKKGSPDSRCGGLCYCFCPAKKSSKVLDKERCDFCPDTMLEFFESGYFRTYYGALDDDDCFCTTICCPLKFPMFFPCLLGSMLNNVLNNLCCAFAHEDRNYLF